MLNININKYKYKYKYNININNNKKVSNCIKSIVGYKFLKINGQSTIEFILVFPIVIISVLIIAQLGYIVYIQNILVNAAEQGARVLATTNSNLQAFNSIYNNCSNLSENNLDVQIYPEQKEVRKIGSYATVVIKYKPDELLNFYSLFLIGKSELFGKSIVRMESEE